MRTLLSIAFVWLCLFVRPTPGHSQETVTPLPFNPTFKGKLVRHYPNGELSEGTLELSIDPLGFLGGTLLIGGQEFPVQGRLEQTSGAIPSTGIGNKGVGYYLEFLPLPDGRANPAAEKVPLYLNARKVVGGGLDAAGVVTAFRLTPVD